MTFVEGYVLGASLTDSPSINLTLIMILLVRG